MRTGPGRRGGVLVAVLVVAAVVAVVAGVVVGGLGDDLAGDDGADDPAAADGAGAGADGSLTTEVADAQTTLVISTDMPLADLVALGAAIEPFDPATPPRLAGAPG